MKILLILAAAITMLALVAGGVMAQSGNELFAQARVMENSEGNITEAIKLYQTIVAKYSSDRDLAARALIQIGLSYEKLGNETEARKAFDRVLRDFKNEKESVTRANARLAALNRARVATPGGGIRGRVTERGRPVGNAQVFVTRTVFFDGERLMRPAVPVRTNDFGVYDLSVLRPGLYYLVAIVFDSLPGNLPPGAPLHLTTYFPGTPNWQRAKLVEVRPGATLSDMNIDVAVITPRTVRGKVTGLEEGNPTAAGQPPPPKVILAARDLQMPGGNPTGLIRVQPDGSFEISRVSPGSYVLYAFQPGGNGGRVDIEVGDRDLDSVNIAMSPGLTVFGRLQPPARGAVVALRPIPSIAGVGPFASVGPFAGVTMADGSFTITGSPNSGPLQRGDYRVSVEPLLPRPALQPGRPSVPQAQSRGYVSSIRLGESDVLNDGLHLREQPEQELVIEHGGRAWVIEGRVVSEQQTPVAGATVVLIPQSGIRFHIDYKVTTSDASGRFRFQSMAPNDYKVFAWENIEYGAWQDPDFVAPHETLGTPVRMIDPIGVQSIEVRAIPPKGDGVPPVVQAMTLP